MPSAPGIQGHIRVDNDFICAAYADVVWGTGVLVSNAFDPFGFTSVNEGSFASTIDEPGGILDILTDNSTGDNAFLFCGSFFPRDGGMRMGARFKLNNLDLLGWVGFQETLSLTTPVMATTFATVTMTYANVGNLVGIGYDPGGTTDDWRAVMGAASAAISDSSNGIRANATLTVDRWLEAEVAVGRTGVSEVWLSDVGHVDGDSIPQLRLIKRFSSPSLISATSAMLAVLGAQNSTGNIRHMEVDYMFAEGNRDRRPT